MTLVDTSTWIDYFRGTGDQQETLDKLLSKNEVCITSMIEFELIPSIILKKEKKLLELVKGIYKIKLDINFDRIVQYQVKNYQSGLNGVGFPDLAILYAVLTFGIPILHNDKHFREMAKVFHFKQK